MFEQQNQQEQQAVLKEINHEQPLSSPDSQANEPARFSLYNHWVASPHHRERVILFSNIESADVDVIEELAAYMPATHPTNISPDDINAEHCYFVKSQIYLDENDEPYVCQEGYGDSWPDTLLHVMENLRMRLDIDKETGLHMLIDREVEYDTDAFLVGEGDGWNIAEWSLRQTQDEKFGLLLCDVVVWERQSDHLRVTTRHGWLPY